MACTGMTWDDILDQFDLPRLSAVSQYWADNPPAHILIARYMGYKPATKTVNSQNQELTSEHMQQLSEMMPSAPAPVYMTTEEYLKRRMDILHE